MPDANDLIFEFRAPDDKLKADLANARGDVRKFGADVEGDVSSFAERVNGVLGSVGSKLNTGLRVALGDFGTAVDSLVSITEAGLRGIPVVGEGIAAAYHQVSGTLLDAIERGLAYNDSLRQQQIQLGLVAKDAAEVKRELTEIGDIAFKTNVGRGFLANAVEDLRLFNVEGRRALDLERALAIQATATGGGEGRAGALTDLIERVLETGKFDNRTVWQFVRQKIPIYDIIADELQVSKRCAMQLIQSGALSGDDLITVLTHAFTGPKWTQAAEEMTQTVEGMTRRYNTAVSKLLGIATQPIHATTVDFLRQAVDTVRGPGAAGIATGVQSAISPVTSMLETAGRALAGGDLFGGAVKGGEDLISGFKAGITNKAGEVVGAAKDFAAGILDTITGPEGFDSHSPSRKMMQVGVNAADGWGVGFIGEMTNVVAPQLEDTIHQILMRAEQAASPGQRRSMKGLDKLTQREPDFLSKLIEGARKRNIDPDWLLNVMATETAGTFNPSVTNQFGYTGLIQFGGDAARDVGTTRDALRKMSGVEQLVYVFKYLDEKMEQYGAIDSQAKLYAAVGAGHFTGSDQSVMFRQGSRGYAANYRVWDLNRDGVIRQGEFGPAAESHLGAGSIFTVNGAANVTSSNPMPVAVVSGDITGGVGVFPPKGAASKNPLADLAVDPDVMAGLQQMSDSITIFNGKAKDSGLYIEGVGDVAQKEVVPALVLMAQLMGDNAQAAQSFGQSGGEALEKLRGRVHGLGESFREMGFTAANISARLSDYLGGALLAGLRHDWQSFFSALEHDAEDFLVRLAKQEIRQRLLKLFSPKRGVGTDNVGDDEGGGGGGGFKGLLRGLLGLGSSGSSASSDDDSSSSGGSSSPGILGKIFGGLGSSSAKDGSSSSSDDEGDSGGSSLASLGAFMTNPWTLAAIGAVVGGVELFHLLGHRHKSEKALRKAINDSEHVDIKEMSVLTRIKHIGEAAFGRGQVPAHLGEVIQLPDVQQIIDDYAAQTGQGKPTLPHEFTYNQLGGPSSAPITVNGNKLLPSSSSGTMPSPFFGASPFPGVGNSGVGEMVNGLFERVERIEQRQMVMHQMTVNAINANTKALQPWGGASAGDLMQRGADERPDAIMDGFLKSHSRHPTRFSDSVLKPLGF